MRNSMKILRFGVGFIAALLAACGGDSTPDRLAHAREFARKGELEKAIIELKSTATSEPDNVELRHELGLQYIKVEDWRNAEKELERAVKLGLPSSDAAVSLTRAKLGLGEYDRIMQEHIGSVVSTPGGAATEGTRDAELLALQGHAYFETRNFDVAERLYRQVLATDERNTEAAYGLARLSGIRGDRKAMRQQLSSLLEQAPNFADGWASLGELDAFEGGVEQADSNFSKAIQNAPRRLIYRVSRAVVRVESGSLDSAEEDLAVIKKMAGRHPAVGYISGLIYSRKGQFDQAKTAFIDCLQSAPDYLPAMYELGKLLAFMGQYQQAEQYLQQVVQALPSYTAAAKILAAARISNGNPEGAKAALIKVFESDPTDEDALNLLAEANLRQGDPNAAIDILRRIVADDSRSGRARLNLAKGLLIAGKPDEAIKNLEDAAGFDPGLEEADRLIILNYLMSKQFDKALEVARQFTERHSDIAAGYNAMGLAYLGKQDKQKAGEMFVQAFSVVPGDPAAGNNLVGLAILDGNYQHAREIYETVLSHNPGHMATTLALAGLETALGDKSQASTRLKSAIKVNPEAIQPKLMLARILISSGDAQGAKDVLSTLPRQTAESPLVLMELARAEVALGNLDSAAEILRRLLVISPNSTDARYLNATVMARLGDSDGERRSLEQAIKANPGFRPAYVALVGNQTKAGRFTDANQTVNAYERRFPGDEDVAPLRAEVAVAMKDFKTALANYQTLMERRPNGAIASRLAEVYWAVGEPENAIKVLQEWSSAHADDTQTLKALGQALQGKGDLHGAQAAFLRVLELKPDDVIALNNLAWSMLDSDSQSSLNYANRALALAPNNSQVLDTAGLALLRTGKAEQAVERLQRAGEISPGDLNIQYHLALSLVRNNRGSDAKVILSRLLSNDAKFSERNNAEGLQQELR